MKNVIIALTSAAVICAASASFAQPKKAESKPGVMGVKRVVIVKVEGTGATEAVSREVTINGKTFTIRPGSSEASKEVTFSAADAHKLMVTYKGIACPISTVMFKPEATATESHISTVVLKLTAKPKAMGMKEGKTECKTFVTVTGKKKV